jgi:tetratricopeptide (TPR) repeat protein
VATVTSEKNKMLAFGEKLRENPKTIWFSLLVLGFAVFWAKIIGDKEMEAGGSGHLGLSFRLLYKHHWKNSRLLDIAYTLFSNAARIGTGNGQPSVRMAMGGVSMEKGDYQRALENYQEGYILAKKMKDTNQAAFLQSHLGIAQIKLNQLPPSKKNLETAYETLTKALKKNLQSLYLHVWASNAEIGLSEWYLAAGDKKKAKVWADIVAKRADKYELKTRKLDAEKLLKRIIAE